MNAKLQIFDDIFFFGERNSIKYYRQRREERRHINVRRERERKKSSRYFQQK